MENREKIEIPEGALIIKQSHWSWGLHTIPWSVLAILSIYIDQITFIGLPLILAGIVILPRYITYKAISYIVTETSLIIKRGPQSEEHLYDEFTDMKISYGIFGQTLGYCTLQLLKQDSSLITFGYVPNNSYLIVKCNERITISSIDEKLEDGESTNEPEDGSIS
mgnify:CR=1 FL=1